MKHRTPSLQNVCLGMVFASTCCAQGTTDPSSVDQRLYGLIPDQPVARLPMVTVDGTSAQGLNTTIAAHTTAPTIPVHPNELNTRVTGLARAFEPPATSGGISIKFVRTPLFMPTQAGVMSLVGQTRAQLQTPTVAPATTAPQEPSVRALAAPPGPSQIRQTGPGRFGNAAALTVFGLDKQPAVADFSAMSNAPVSTGPKAGNTFGFRPGSGGFKVEIKLNY